MIYYLTPNHYLIGNTPVKSREQAWYSIEPDSDSFNLDPDTKICMDQIANAYQTLQIALQSANRVKLAGVDKLQIALDTKMEIFMATNHCKIRKL